MDPEPESIINIWNIWIVIGITLLCSAFFSGMEIAFVSANRLKIELDKNRGSTAGKILSFFVQNSSRFISAMLLGNNIALVVYGIYMAMWMEPWLIGLIGGNDFLILFIQTIISTLIVLLTAEFLPKAIFRINPNGILTIAAIPLVIVYGLFYVPVIMIMFLSNTFLKLMKADVEDSQQAFTKVDLDHYVRDLSDRIEEDAHMENEIQILNNALEFSNIKARDCMIPRTDIVACNIEDDISDLKQKFISTGLSKILIYRDSIDNIIGYVHAYELFNKPEKIKNVMLPIGVVPEAIYAKELLEQLSKTNRNIVVVVDEFGGTAGIITVEDIIEEIFGEIEDEHDQESVVEDELENGSYLFSGRLEIDYLNQEYDLDLEELEEYETLAGYVIHHLEEIPKLNEFYESDDYRFTVVEVADSRIELIRIDPVE
jgi:CBS domain containing-hemolysin-like protein